MDNIPTPPPESEQTPPAPTPSPVPHAEKPEWVKGFVALFGAALVLTIAVAIGSSFYYQVEPLPAPLEPPYTELPGATYDPVPGTPIPFETKPFNLALASAVVTDPERCQYNSVYDPYHNLSTTTLLEQGQGVCKIFVEQKGAALQFTLNTEGPAYMESAFTGAGIITYNNKPYLVSFTMYPNIQVGQYELSLAQTTLLQATQVSSLALIPIAELASNEVRLLRVEGSDASGQRNEEYFGRLYGHYADGSFYLPVVKNSDGTFSNKMSEGFDYGPAKVSFLIPYAAWRGAIASDRDFQMERDSITQPLYHRASCGLEETYGDMGFGGGDVEIDINFGYSPTLYITSARIGYVPTEWGKVTGKTTMDDFRARVAGTATVQPASPVETLTINGRTIKHIGPIIPDRTCRNQEGYSYDMYQTIQNGAVISFTITRNSSDPKPTPDIQKIMAQVLSTITFSPR